MGTQYAQPILDDANGHLEDTYGHIKTAIGSILEGRSYSDEEVKELIAPVPDKNLKKVCLSLGARGILFDSRCHATEQAPPSPTL